MISAGLIVVLIEQKASVRSSINTNPQGIRVLHSLDSRDLPGKRYNPPGPCQHGNTLQGPIHHQGPPSLIDHSCINIIPDPFWQPYSHRSHIQTFYPGCSNRRRYQLTAKKILISCLISPILLRTLIIHRADHRQIFPVIPIIHGIQIRNHPVPLPQGLPHDLSCLPLKPPGFLAVKLAFCAVKAHNRRINPKLGPSCRQFIILIALHMSADVMAPPAIADIGCHSRKMRLKIKGFPCRNRVPGKSHRIAVASGTRIP